MKKLVGLLIALLLIVLSALPVLAIADPDSAPSVNAVYVYEDLLEEGDVGVLIDYYLDYAALPSETATEAYLAIFVDTDGTTQLRAAAPYAYVDSGYGRGLIWIYFDAADATTYGLDSTDVALYRVWLAGNPMLTWVAGPDPPKTIATIDTWYTTGDPNVLLALQILYYADLLELEWSLDLIESTSLGNRLTELGADYFDNAIADARDLAPSAFPTTSYSPIYEDVDYSTTFGAIMTDGTGTVVGSPVTLTEGANVVNVTVAGTFILELEKGTEGTATSLVGTVTGSPVALVYGINTITVPGGGTGTITITVNLVNTAEDIEDNVTGTALDLTDAATAFGMSRWMFSGLVWLIVTVIICASVYTWEHKQAGGYVYHGAGKVTFLLFDVCIVGGAVIGLVHPLVAALLFIGAGAYTAYILFFRGANA